MTATGSSIARLSADDPRRRAPTLAEGPPGSARLHSLIRRCGLATILACALHIPLSFALAPFSPRGTEQPREEQVLSGVVAALALPAPAEAALTRVVRGESPLRNRAVRAVAFVLPVGVSTAAVVLVLIALLRGPAAVEPATASLLLRFAFGIAALSTLAYPVFTNDFWLSVGWGRLIVEGGNPYVQDMTPTSMAGLPIVAAQEHMTYGPLWAWIAAAITRVASQQVLLEFLLFKLLLAGSWIGALLLVRQVAARRSPLHAALAVCIFGWIPASSRLTIAEGHNDIVMVLLMTGWLYLLVSRRSGWSPLTLAASVLVKYVTAPLVALELLHAAPRARASPGRYALTLAACAAAAAALFAPFTGQGSPFAAASSMRGWTFWTPATALVSAADRIGLMLPHRIATALIAAVCAALIVGYLRAYLRSRSDDALIALALAIMITVLLVGVGHVWPWFAIWVLPLAAIRWDSAPGRLVVPALLALPLLNAHWILAQSWRSVPDVGLAFYGVVLVLAVLADRFVLRPAEPAVAAWLSRTGARSAGGLRRAPVASPQHPRGLG